MASCIMVEFEMERASTRVESLATSLQSIVFRISSDVFFIMELSLAKLWYSYLLARQWQQGFIPLE